MPRLPPLPELEWSDDGAPRARAFDDVYFSREGGLAESDVVFLGGCDLPHAWIGRDRFAVCELGFGTGLNVLATWRAWKATRLPHALLHISSIEAFPLAREDAARALSAFPEVSELAAKLIECWPTRVSAPQRFWFPEDGFALTLRIGDAEAELARMSGSYDAWFLDGFAPARNEAMWGEAIFAHIARLSAPDARLATFTVAGHVRRNLEHAGFSVEKKPGFGTKRERLEAYNNNPSPLAGEGREGGRASNDANAAAALNPDRPPPPTPAPPGGGGFRVAIIGAGIAGASCAHALVKRGIETIVLDEAPALGASASGNPAGLVMPRLDRGGALSEVFLASYLAAIRQYHALGVLEACGIEERARPGNAAALADLLADPPLPADWFQATGEGAALHVRAGLVIPRLAIEHMLKGAELLLEAEIGAIERGDAGWVLRAPDGRARLKADAVVLACGAALTKFAPARFLPIELSRGQIEWGALRGEAPARALAQGAYVAPFERGVLFGATFDKIDAYDGVVADANSLGRNLDALALMAPEIASRIDVSSLSSRASIRATTQDRAPIMGALPDAQVWSLQNPAVHEGMFILGGLGARGLTLAPLLGEEVASLLLVEPSVLSMPASGAIDPARFLKRRARRGS